MTTTEPTQADMCRAIAEKVMGWSDVRFGKNSEDRWRHPVERFSNRVEGPNSHGFPPDADVLEDCRQQVPDYFTDPAAMVALMEKVGIWPQCVGSGWVSIGTHPTNICESPMHAVALAAYQLALTR